MGKNKRKITKMKHKVNEGDEKVLVSFNGSSELVTSGEYTPEEFKVYYIKKHFGIKENLFRNADKGIQVLIETGRIKDNKKIFTSKSLSEVGKVNIYFRSNDKQKIHKTIKGLYEGSNKKTTDCIVRQIDKNERTLLENREKFFKEINTLYFEVSKSQNTDGTAISYNEEAIENLCEYIETLKTDKFFNRQSREFLDEKSQPLYAILISKCTRGYNEQKFVAFLTKVVDTSFDGNVKDEFIKIFVTQPNHVISATFNQNATKSKPYKDLKMKGKFDFDVVKQARNEFNHYNFKRLEELVKKGAEELQSPKELNPPVYRDELIGMIRSKIRENYNDLYQDYKWEELSQSQKQTVKIINNYIRSRTNKTLKRFEKNCVLSQKDIESAVSLYEEKNLKPRVENAIRNKYLYKLNYSANEDKSSLEKMLLKANITFEKKLISEIDDFVYNIILKDETEDTDLWGYGNYDKIIEALVSKHTGYEETIKKFLNGSIVDLENTEDAIYAIYVLRNIHYHFEQPTDVLPNFDESKRKESIAKYPEKNTKLIEVAKDIKFDLLKESLLEQLKSNSCTMYYSKDEINKVLSKIDIHSSKSSILPRFNKVYVKLLEKEQLKSIKSDDKSFLTAHKYLLKIIYENYFSKNIDEEYYIKQKADKMSICRDEFEMRKAENKFTNIVTQDFYEFIEKEELIELFKVVHIAKDSEIDVNTLDIKTTTYNAPDINLFTACIINAMPFIKVNMLSKLKGNIGKYKTFITEVENMDDSQSVNDKFLFSKEEADYLIKVIETEIINKNKNDYSISNEAGTNFQQKLEIFEKAYKALGDDIDLKYVPTNELGQANEVDIFNKDTLLRSDNFKHFRFILEYEKYGHLDLFLDLNKSVIKKNQLDINNILNEYAEFKSTELNPKLLNKNELSPQLFKDYKIENEATNIAKLTKVREIMYKDLRAKTYERLNEINKAKKENKKIPQAKKVDTVAFGKLLKEYSKVNEAVLRFNFYHNILHLKMITKSYNLFSDLNSRILTWQLDYAQLIQSNKKLRGRTEEILKSYYYDTSEDIDKYNNYEFIFRDARHYNTLRRGTTGTNAKTDYKNIKDMYFGENSLSEIYLLTNFRNDIDTVYTNTLSDYNITFKNGKQAKYNPRVHQLFNKKTLVDIFGGKEDDYTDINLISKEEVKYLETLVSKSVFNNYK